jgi:hypothetical protein
MLRKRVGGESAGVKRAVAVTGAAVRGTGGAGAFAGKASRLLPTIRIGLLQSRLAGDPRTDLGATRRAIPKATLRATLRAMLRSVLTTYLGERRESQ